MDNGNNFFKKNWLTLILIALLGGVSIMWIKDMNETKAKEEAAYCFRIFILRNSSSLATNKTILYYEQNTNTHHNGSDGCHA